MSSNMILALLLSITSVLSTNWTPWRGYNSDDMFDFRVPVNAKGEFITEICVPPNSGPIKAMLAYFGNSGASNGTSGDGQQYDISQCVSVPLSDTTGLSTDCFNKVQVCKQNQAITGLSLYTLMGDKRYDIGSGGCNGDEDLAKEGECFTKIETNWTNSELAAIHFRYDPPTQRVGKKYVNGDDPKPVYELEYNLGYIRNLCIDNNHAEVTYSNGHIIRVPTLADEERIDKRCRQVDIGVEKGNECIGLGLEPHTIVKNGLNVCLIALEVQFNNKNNVYRNYTYKNKKNIEPKSAGFELDAVFDGDDDIKGENKEKEGLYIALGVILGVLLCGFIFGGSYGLYKKYGNRNNDAQTVPDEEILNDKDEEYEGGDQQITV